MDVSVVYWPAEAARLERLREAGEPRLVIVEHGPPPATIDELEDWIRGPAADVDLRIRLTTLRERAARRVTEMSLEDGVLRLGSRIVVVLPPIEARLAGALLARTDAVVGRELLAHCAWPEGPPSGRTVLDVHIAKLRRLLAGTGLDIRTVHGRGYLMHRIAADQSPVTSP